MDVQKQIGYWRDGATEEIDAAGDILNCGRIRQGLFWAELALEKALKAHVAKATSAVPPKTHDLLKLSSIAGLSLSLEQRLFLARIQQYCLEGRYPDSLPPAPSRQQAMIEYQECKEMVTWLIDLLKQP